MRPKRRDAQVSVRIPASIDAWLEQRAGEIQSKADVVRDLIEAEIAREELQRLPAMFDLAARDLTAEDREDRELLLGGFSDQE